TSGVIFSPSGRRPGEVRAPPALFACVCHFARPESASGRVCSRRGPVAPHPGPTGAPMTASGTELRRLIERARRAEPGALDRLLDSYRNSLRLWARTGLAASLQGKADPSDLVQDALLRAAENFGQFRGASDAELAGWLRQILARCLANFVRRYRTGARRLGRE